MNPNIAALVGINLNNIPIYAFDNRTAHTNTKDGEQLRSFTIHFREPLFQNGYIEGTRNSLELQNVGTTKVLVNGAWTILAGGSKKFDSSNNIDVNSDKVTIYFPDDPFNSQAGNRLEVCEIILSDASVAFYRQKGIETI